MAGNYSFHYFDPIQQSNVLFNATYEQILAHPERYYQGSDIAWMATCSALVLLMVPGLGLFYSGASATTSALALIRLPLITAAVIGAQWFIWGYNLAFSPAAKPGETSTGRTSFWTSSTDGIAFRNVAARPVGDPNGPQIPELVYALYQGMFACFTAALVSGGTYGKVRPRRFVVFVIFWSTLVYDIIARWTWYFRGWQKLSGSLDFAGGTAVHICSGATVAGYALFYGFVDMYHTGDHGNAGIIKEGMYHNTINIMMGTALLWIGWLGFNGGSALGINVRAVSACMNTVVAPAFGGSTSIALHWAYAAWIGGISEDQERLSLSAHEFCDGVVIALVAITPAAGFVPVSYAPVFGVVSSIALIIIRVCREQLTERFGERPDGSQRRWLPVILLDFDSLDIFIIHSGGGMIGMCLTGLFLRQRTVALDGFSQLDPNSYKEGIQLGRQLRDATLGGLYSCIVTILLLMMFYGIEWLLKRGPLNFGPVEHDMIAMQAQERRADRTARENERAAAQAVSSRTGVNGLDGFRHAAQGV